MITDINVKPFLLDVVRHVEPFRASVQRIFVEREAGDLKVIGFAMDRSMLIRGTALTPLADFSAPACLASLGYLKSILESTPVREGAKLEFVYENATNGQLSLRKILFKDKRTNFTYQAADPFAAGYEKRKGTAQDQETVDFVFDAESIKIFEEATRVQLTSDEKGKLFSLSCKDGEVRATFQGRGHGSDVLLAIKTDAKSTSPILLDIQQMKQVLKLCERGANVKIARRGVIFEFKTESVLYNFSLVERKIVV